MQEGSRPHEREEEEEEEEAEEEEGVAVSTYMPAEDAK